MSWQSQCPNIVKPLADGSCIIGRADAVSSVAHASWQSQCHGRANVLAEPKSWQSQCPGRSKVMAELKPLADGSCVFGRADCSFIGRHAEHEGHRGGTVL
jgi:hypothetical protein